MGNQMISPENQEIINGLKKKLPLEKGHEWLFMSSVKCSKCGLPSQFECYRDALCLQHAKEAIGGHQNVITSSSSTITTSLKEPEKAHQYAFLSENGDTGTFTLPENATLGDFKQMMMRAEAAANRVRNQPPPSVSSTVEEVRE